MPNRPVLIDSFIDVPGTAEIVGVGGVRQPRGEAQEVEVEVVVAADMDAPDFDPVRDVASHWLGCGQLDLLSPGSRWIDGRRAGCSSARKVEAAFECAWQEDVGVGTHPQPRGRPFPSRRFATTSGFVLRRAVADHEPAGVGVPGDPDHVLLPPMELLRTLFGVSGGFLLELFDGIRDTAVSGERGLVSRRLSRLREDGTVLLVAGRVLSRDEALMAAAVVADDAVRALHDSAFQQLSVDADARAGRFVNLSLAWPWRAPVPMRVEGRWVDRVDAPRRFVVSRVRAIGVPLSFVRIEVHHPGSEKGDREDLPPPEGRIRPANARIVVLTTGRAGSTARRPVEIATGTLDLITSTGIEVVSVARGGAVRGDRAGMGEEPRDAAPFGSGGRQPGADPEVGSATIRRRALPGETPERTVVAALEMTWRALQTACSDKGWTLQAMLGPGRPFGSEAHDGLDFAREPLVVMVKAAGRRLIVVDRGSPSGQECSLGLLVPKESAAGSTDAALVMSARAACESVDGRWGSRNLRTSRFDVRAVVRAGVCWTDADAYARMLAARITSALRG